MDTKSVSDDAPTSLGMILEDNDASVGGVYVKEITPNSPAGDAEGLMEGAQIVSISGKSVKGANFESVMEILKASESPVDVQFYDVGTLY
jgi:C-terminal processing protease CtpA/Prc